MSMWFFTPEVSLNNKVICFILCSPLMWIFIGAGGARLRVDDIKNTHTHTHTHTSTKNFRDAFVMQLSQSCRTEATHIAAIFQQAMTGSHCLFNNVLCSFYCLFCLDQGDSVRWFAAQPDCLSMVPGGDNQTPRGQIVCSCVLIILTKWHIEAAPVWVICRNN